MNWTYVNSEGDSGNGHVTIATTNNEGVTFRLDINRWRRHPDDAVEFTGNLTWSLGTVDGVQFSMEPVFPNNEFGGFNIDANTKWVDLLAAIENEISPDSDRYKDAIASAKNSILSRTIHFVDPNEVNADFIDAINKLRQLK